VAGVDGTPGGVQGLGDDQPTEEVVAIRRWITEIRVGCGVRSDGEALLQRAHPA
jgi:hypothetical protein